MTNSTKFTPKKAFANSPASNGPPPASSPNGTGLPSTAPAGPLANGKPTPATPSDPDKYATVPRQHEAERKRLPIYGARQAILDAIQRNASVVIVGETGSGKTTQIPQFILEADLAKYGGIAVTQPRRVAATSLARRVAEEVGTPLGKRVGYTVRFDDKSSPSTKLKYLTDGMLMREILSDPLLHRYNYILLDEAHERTLRTDILFGMLKEIQQTRRQMCKDRKAQWYRRRVTDEARRGSGPPAEANGTDSDLGEHVVGGAVSTDAAETISASNGQPRFVHELKIIIMSATLDAERFAAYFDHAKILYVAGRQFPVRVYNSLEPQTDYLDAAFVASLQIHTEQGPGDILIFLTGQEEIETLEKLLTDHRALLPRDAADILICPLFAALPPAQQAKVFNPAPPNTRKIILATNIAETSITLPGIRYVLDTGVHKARGYNSKVGIESLLVEPISKSSARQRTGRAGREALGFCYRLYTEDSFMALEEDSVPEILRCNLAAAVLQLKAAGVRDVLRFDYMDRPPKLALLRALEQLYSLAALDDTGALTKLGTWMAEFPLDPCYAKVLYESRALQCTTEIIDIISLLSVDNLFVAPFHKREEANEARNKFISPDGDHLTYLNLLRAYQAVKGDIRWCHENYVNARGIQHALEVRKQLRQVCTRVGMDPNVSCGVDLDRVLQCFVAGFFHQTALLQPDGTYKSVIGSQFVRIHPASTLFNSRREAILFNELVFTTKLYVRGVSAIQANWIPEASPNYLKRGQPKSKPALSS
ncbi:ATP-dependent RNA helicase [Tieghemiomyces parasiticus]|uniref:RNA helicase n=1 Tax=Tieghemiomyces parasiticus TaxID=78921 RepID=A0A9W8A4L7_9FUNG|nr:ATP-dependent RNA helicase [Tieghemiomyces parasiticus]